MAGPLKRQRLSISNGDRVCMLSLSHSADEGGEELVDEYKLYFLDLEISAGGGIICDTNPIPADGAAGFTYILPNLRFDVSTRPLTFCLLGSTLYIFEGFQYPKIEYQGKLAFKLDLCQTTFPPNHKVEDSELERHKVRGMHTSKFRPRAVPTPDGKKILVFSTRFLGVGEEDPDFHFELYDPSADSWEKLPGFSSFHFIQMEPWSISAYSFINNHLFFFQLPTAMFVLDLESIGKGWRCIGDVHDSDPFVPWDNGYFPTINSEFVFTCSKIYDAREFGLSREERAPKPSVIVPQSSFPPTNLEPYPFDFSAIYPSITLLRHDIDRKVLHWCALNCESVPFSTDDVSFTRVLLDGCITNLSKLNTQIKRTLQLLIDHRHCLCDIMLVPTVLS